MKKIIVSFVLLIGCALSPINVNAQAGAVLKAAAAVAKNGAKVASGASKLSRTSKAAGAVGALGAGAATVNAAKRQNTVPQGTYQYANPLQYANSLPQKGLIFQVNGQRYIDIPCTNCNRTGFIPYQGPCRVCQGWGFVRMPYRGY